MSATVERPADMTRQGTANAAMERELDRLRTNVQQLGLPLERLRALERELSPTQPPILDEGRVHLRLLLAEGDRPLALFIAKRLEAEGYAVDIAAGPAEACALAAQNDYQLLILDAGNSEVEGLAMLADFRSKRQEIPLLALTAGAKVEERIGLLDSGADDCVTKPFSSVELAARVRALLRRTRAGAVPVVAVADLELNRLERRVRRAGRPIELTTKEFHLLEFLMQNAGRPVSRSQILVHVWNQSHDTRTNIVDVYVNYLRKKIDEPFPSQLIRTVRGQGYQIGAPAAVEQPALQVAELFREQPGHAASVTARNQPIGGARVGTPGCVPA